MPSSGNVSPEVAGPLVASVFVGRAPEMAALRSAADDVLAGAGRLVLLAGDPGIGKTRITAEVAAHVGTRDFGVLWGRCQESPGAPVYWPWVQMLRACAAGCEPSVLARDLGAGAADVAQVVPAVRERLPDLPPVPTLQPEQARFRLFDGVTTYLTNLAARRPLLLVLDDLHWAEKPTLLLLQFLAREMASARLLILATYRDAEVDRRHPLFDTLAELVREPVSHRLRLRGLSEQEVACHIEQGFGLVPSPRLVAAVYGQTEGNPFFVGEVMRLLAAEGRLDRGELTAPSVPVPPGVRQVIGRRLNRLSAESNAVLTAAAALGTEFTLHVLRRLGDLPQDRLLDLLEEAVAAGVVTEIPHGLARYGFAHALIRELLYDELPPARRARLHHAIGEALEVVHQADVEPHLAEIAHHFFVASPVGDAERAIAYARRAGQHASETLAFEEAGAQYERALHVLDLLRPGDRAMRCELLLALGEARMRAADVARGRETLEQAARLARAIGAPERLARAALAFGGTAELARRGSLDPTLVTLLEEALSALPEHDKGLRARVLGRLATALYWSAPRDRRAALSAEAVTLARALADPATLARVLNARCWSLWGPDDLEDRLAAADEMVELADTSGDRELALMGRAWRILGLAETGEMARVDAELGVCALMAADFRVPQYLWWSTIVRTMRALLEGRFEEAVGLAGDAMRLGQRAGVPDWEEAYGLQTMSVLRSQGRLGELLPLFLGYVAESPEIPAVRGALAYVYAELGRLAEAREELERLAARDFADLPRDFTWMIAVATLAETCALVGDARRAATLYRLLLPYNGRVVLLGFGTDAAGAVSRYLALLATTMGRFGPAARHFEDALATHAEMRALPWLARTQHDLARMLIVRGERGDVARARQLLAMARETAEALGMQGLLERTTALDQAVAAIPDTQLPPPEGEFHRDGSCWIVSYRGTSCRLRDSMGLRYLAHLLRHPGVDIHVRDLVAAVHGAPPVSGGVAGAGPLLDAEAKLAYRRRLVELQEERAEAERSNDPGRAGRAQAETDFITRQLAAAVGLGGRDRLAASEAERARIAVRKGIKAGLELIRRMHPALGHELAASIKTGYCCVYAPAPSRGIAWRF